MKKQPVRTLLCIEKPPLRVHVITLLNQSFPELFLHTVTCAEDLQEPLVQRACDAVISDCPLPIPEHFEPWASRPLILRLVNHPTSPAPDADVCVGQDALDEIPDHIRSHLQKTTPNLNRPRHYQAFFDTALDAVFIGTVDGAVLDCNTAAAQMFGYTKAELCALRVEDLMTEDSVARLFALRQNDKDTPILLQTESKRRDGTVFPTELSTRRVTIDGQRVVVAYVRDITSEKQTRTALLESERLYRTLFEQASDAIFIESEDGQILDANPQACELMGYSHQELLQLTVPDLQASEARQTESATLKQTLDRHPGLPFESVHLHRDGTLIPVEVTNSVLRCRDSHLILSVVRDIRARKALEEQRRRQEARLRRQQDTLIRLSTDAELINHPLRPALQVVAQETAEVLGVERANVWRHSDAPPGMRCIAAVENGRDRETENEQRRLTRERYPHYFAVFENQRALAASNVLEDERTAGLAAYWRSWGITSTLDAPVRLRGKTIGLICFEHTGAPREWGDDEITFASQVADLIAQLFMNADLRQRAEEMTAIAEISQQITTLDSLDTVLRFIARRAAEILGVDAGGMLAQRPNEEYILALHGFKDKVAQWLREPQPSDTLTDLFGFIRAQEGVIQIPDAQGTTPEIVRHGMEAIEAEALLVIPFDANEGGVNGYLGVLSRTPHHFGPEDISFLKTLTRQSINALENAYILQAEQERRELAEALSKAAAIVNSNLDPEEVLDRILEQVARVVDGETFNILLLQGKAAVSMRRRGYESREGRAGSQEAVLPVQQYPLLQQMIDTREPVVVPNTAQTSSWTSNLKTEWRRSYVGVPICIGTETVGFLNVNSTQPDRFDQADARRLKTFADYAATAIQNARLFQRLREHANFLEQKVQARTAELQAQYARLEAVLNSTTDGIIVTTTEGEILQENLIVAAWRREAFSEKDATRFQEAVASLAHNAASRPDVVLEMSRLDLQLRAAPITGAQTGAADVVIAVHDVSQLKTLERMKSQFISNVSHELRTPITTIKLYLQLLRQSSPEKHAAYLEALETEAERQAKLIQEILEFSSLNTGQMEIPRHPIQLNRLVEAVCRGQHPLAQQKEISLKWALKNDLPDAFGNPGKVKQVLINLVVNAIQYSPSGGEVIVSTGVRRQEGQMWITAQVQDAGFGIPPEELPHIFKRFYRGEKPRSLQISGTGLGLAIVKEIMELHQGWVTVESELDSGSTFTIGLPSAASVAECEG